MLDILLSITFSLSFLAASSTTTTAFAPVVRPPSQSHRRQLTTDSRVGIKAQGNNEAAPSTDDWELADGISEPVPTTVEIFLTKKYPEFFFLLSKNEDALKVIREDTKSSSSEGGGGGGGVTFFAPSTEAFERLGSKRLQQLEDERNTETAQKIAAYHVVATEAVQAQRLFTEDWTKGRPKDGSKPAFTVEGIQTLGGTVPVGRSKSGGIPILGWGAKEDGEAVLGTSNARIVRSYFVGKDRKCIVHEMDGLVSPDLLWRYADQLRIPGF